MDEPQHGRFHHWVLQETLQSLILQGKHPAELVSVGRPGPADNNIIRNRESGIDRDSTQP